MSDFVSGNGPTFRWFAWRPTYTRDRGWRWLRMLGLLWRRLTRRWR